MFKTQEQLAREDAEFYKELNKHIERLEKEGYSPEAIGDFVYFYGGPPSACDNGSCDCPMH